MTRLIINHQILYCEVQAFWWRFTNYILEGWKLTYFIIRTLIIIIHIAYLLSCYEVFIQKPPQMEIDIQYIVEIFCHFTRETIVTVCQLSCALCQFLKMVNMRKKTKQNYFSAFSPYCTQSGLNSGVLVNLSGIK